jgi:hypothetical protein
MRRQIGPTRSTCARDGEDKKRGKKTKTATSPYWGDETPAGTIAMNFVLSPGLTDIGIINCAKYELDLLRGFQLAGP